MTRFSILIGLLAAAILIAGCKKEEPARPRGGAKEVAPAAPAAPVAPAAPAAPLPADESAQTLADAKAKLAAIQAAIKGGRLDEAEAELKALEAMEGLPADMKAQIGLARGALDAARATQATAETESMLAKILALIKEGKLDDAEKELTALEAAKDSQPQSLQDRTADARKALDAAKALQTPAIPKLPTIPKLPG